MIVFVRVKFFWCRGFCLRNMLLECDVYIIFYMSSLNVFYYRSIWFVNKLVMNVFKEEFKI